MRAHVVDGDRDAVVADGCDLLQEGLRMQEQVTLGEFERHLEAFTCFVQRNEALDEACERFQVAFELTERHLLSHPKALLEKVAAIRGDGIAIAIDDVGAHPDSLAVLDILDPDIVKLDMTMIQSSAQRDKANTLTGVLAHQERTGALIIAEGVETDEDLEQALAMGAGLAQGFRFGRGHPLGSQQRATGLPPAVRVERSSGSAHAAAEDDRKPLRVARKHVVAGFVRQIVDQARHSIDHPIVLAAVQRAQEFGSGERELLGEIAATSPLVVVLGQDVPADVGGGVRGVELHPDDPLCLEWSWSCWARIRAGRWWHANSAVPQSMTATGGTNS